MNNNLLKNKLNGKLKNRHKKTLIKNKNIDGIVFVKNRQIAKNIAVNNKIILTNEQLKPYIDNIANKDAKLMLDELKKYPLALLDKAFKEIDSSFLFLNQSKDFFKHQVKILVSQNLETHLKRQAIKTLSSLRLKDIALLKILKNIYDLADILSYNFQVNWYNLEFFIINQKGEKHFIKKTIENIKDEVNDQIFLLEEKLLSYEKKYGIIQFQNFKNMLKNNVIKHHQITHIPLLELLYKLFIEYSIDKSKNKEYYNEDLKTRVKKRRHFWKEWFNEDKFKETEIENIKNKLLKIFNKIPMKSIYEERKNCNMHFLITSIGYAILNKFK